MSSPTFNLAACPRCSSFAGGLYQPFWKYAHNTSARRGRNCYFWVAACRHAAQVASADQIHDEPVGWATIEAAWKSQADTLFQEMTAAWSPAQRERWRAMLESRSNLPGATAPLNLSAE